MFTENRPNVKVAEEDMAKVSEKLAELGIEFSVRVVDHAAYI